MEYPILYQAFNERINLPVEASNLNQNTSNQFMQYIKLPIRSGPRPETTPNIPHVQVGVDVVPAVHESRWQPTYLPRTRSGR